MTRSARAPICAGVSPPGTGPVQMVQPGARLVERVPAPVPVLGEPQPSLQPVVPEKHLATCPVRRLELACAPKAEHLLIPRCARVNVTNRQPEMVDTPDHAPAHRVLVRATSRAGLALNQSSGTRRPAYHSIISSSCRTTPGAP